MEPGIPHSHHVAVVGESRYQTPDATSSSKPTVIFAVFTAQERYAYSENGSGSAGDLVA
jgi:hypothetical protein